MHLKILLLNLVLLMALASDYRNSTLTIQVNGAPSDDGLVQGLLFKGPEGFPDNPEKAFKTLSASINGGTAIIEVAEVPPGKYAVVVFHDHDSDGEMRKGAFGIPKDAYGFSNDARNRFSAPSFESAAFEVGDKDVSISFKILN